MNKVVITSISELEKFAETIVEQLFSEWVEGATLLTLTGNLGAGKTTFTQTLAKKLGVTESVSSPTFVIEQRYDIENHDWFNQLVHIDAYRLEDKDEAQKIGLDQTLTNPEKLVVVEWPEQLGNFVDSYKRLSIELNYNPETEIRTAEWEWKGKE